MISTIQSFWIRHLRNAAALARLRVLNCLKLSNCLSTVGTGAGGDITKRFDNVAEQAVIEYFRKFSSFTLISEEAGIRKIGSHPEGVLLIDPIDGSTNVSQGIPFACISVAFAQDPHFEAVEAGVILELFSGICYHAKRGGGAYREEEKIRPNPPRSLNTSIVGVDDSFPPRAYGSGNMLAKAQHLQYTRHLGANALELCYVADGKLDGFIDLRGVFRGTDLAAAALILREAGAALIDTKGEEISGKCTNDERYALIAGRDAPFAKELLSLAFTKKPKPKKVEANR